MKVSCGERRSFWMMGILCFWVLILFRIAHATTDQSDVQAIQVLYSSLNNPSQLTGWKQNGGDPCGESWKGISCSDSSVTTIRIPGLGLTGSMGYMLSSLTSLKELDLSNNKIQLSIPYQLPPNVTYLKLGGNNLTGNLPYSISTLVSLNYLNISHNSLSEPIGDLFAKLTDIDTLDLSYNNFSGNLPNSFSSFSNLSSLYLQNNLLTGNVTVLANLPQLDNLNIANNRFSGWLPSQFNSLSNLDISGNSFNVGPAPPPPPFVPPPTSRPRRKHNTTGAPNTSPNEPRVYTAGAKKLAAGTIVGIVMGSLFFLLGGAFLIICCLKGSPKKKEKRDVTVSNLEVNSTVSANKAMQEQPKVDPRVTSLKPPPENVVGARPFGKDAFPKKAKSPITAASYTIASLQVATNSFSQDYLIGEGSLGRVYRAEYPNGKVLAVKKIDSSALALQEEDDFLEAVSHMSRLRHPNIAQLLGYCAEHGQHLLVYEFFGNGNLHDMLHFTEDDMSYFTEDGTKILAWNSRVRAALGTARALEYLHEVCLPPVVHRNFKSANILLDDDLNPHLSDCGLASLTPNTERQVSTHMLDSFGYSAPEFAMSGTYTAKSDVYSFGVVMLELLTGRKPLDSSRPRSEQSLVRWAIPQLHDIDALAKMVDPSLKGMYPVKSLSRFADIIALCVQPEPEFRPPMSEVVQALVRLVQRATVNTRRSSDEAAISYKISEHDPSDLNV